MSLQGSIIFVNALNVTNMKERLAQFLKLEGLTAVKFAEIMEVQPSSISHLLAGRNKPNFEFISRMLLRFPELNPDWVINGLGEMYKSVNTPKNDLFTDVNKESVTEVNQEKIEEKASVITGVNDKQDADNHSNITHIEPAKQSITDVNYKIRADIPREDLSHSEKEAPKKIARVIIFFADGTLEDYRPD